MVENGAAAPDDPYSFTGGSYSVKPNCAFVAATPEEFGATITIYGVIVNPSLPSGISSETGDIIGNLISSNPNITGTFHAIRVPAIAVSSAPPI
jgi:hypothetical protein